MARYRWLRQGRGYARGSPYASPSRYNRCPAQLRRPGVGHRQGTVGRLLDRAGGAPSGTFPPRRLAPFPRPLGFDELTVGAFGEGCRRSYRSHTRPSLGEAGTCLGQRDRSGQGSCRGGRGLHGSPGPWSEYWIPVGTRASGRGGAVSRPAGWQTGAALECCP